MKFISTLVVISLISYSVHAQNVGIGTTTPLRAKLEVYGVAGVGATSGLFGGDGTGISLQKDWPSIGFNQYRDGPTGFGKHIGTGFAANQYLDPNTGILFLDMLSSGITNSEITTSNNALKISNMGYVGVNGAGPNSELQLPNRLNNRKITLWENANNPYQYYGFGIRSGELTYNVGDIDAIHTFQSGASATGSIKLLQFGRSMDIQVYTQNIILTKNIPGDQNLIISNRSPGTAQNPTTYINNSVLLGRYMLEGGAADNTVAVGYMAGRLLGGTGTGPYRLNNCTFLGNYTTQIYPGNYINGTYSNSMALGYQSTISSSNQVRIGNFDITSIGGSVGWSTLSDGRLKKDITDHVSGINFIMKLRPVQYKYDRAAFNRLSGLHSSETDLNNKSVTSKDNVIYSGFIAQEVEEAANQSGFIFSGIDKPASPDGFYALRYADFVVPLVKAVQEQQQVIEKQQQQIDGLMKELQALKEKINIEIPTSM